MLGGNPVLVLETEFIIALDLGARLQDLGAGHVVLAHDPDSARVQREAWAQASLAVLEIQESRPGLMAFAEEVRASGTPVILVTTDAGLRQQHLGTTSRRFFSSPSRRRPWKPPLRRPWASRARALPADAAAFSD